MRQILLYPVGNTDACRYAANYLHQAGVPLVDHPTPEATHLLLDIPSFRADGNLRDGTDPVRILERLPKSITVIGGSLNFPVLENHKTIDLLQQEHYLAKNAAITADCALRLAAPLLDCTFSDAPTLVIGWGRIGKCLAQKTRDLGASVTVAVRKESDHAILQALGYHAIYVSQIPSFLSSFQILFNTIPTLILSESVSIQHSDIHMFDLASCTGLEGGHIIQARGLPSRYAPKSSGRLIADSVLQFL